MRGIFYGWVIVGAGIAITCIGMGAVISFGVFLQPMELATGWSRTGISTAAMLNFLAMGLAGFGWGAVSDRIGTRTVVLAGGVLLGAALWLASRAESLAAFQLSFGVLAGAAAGAFPAPLTASAARWFTRHRGLAVALVTAGIGMGSMVVAPLARALTNAHDWRFAMAVLGTMAWAIVIPAALLLRRAPVQPALPGEAAPASVRQALLSPQLAAIGATYFACCAAHSGPIFHMVTYAIECGVNPMSAATVLGTAGLAGLCGRIGGGFVADRIGAKATILAGLALQAGAILLYLVVREATGFYALAALFGLSYGAVMPLYAVLVRAWFGAAVMGTAFGAVTLLSTVGMAIGPLAGGWVHDAWGEYAWLYLGSAAIGAGALAIAATFRPPVLRPALA